MEPLIKELLKTIAQEVESLERFLALLLDQENVLLSEGLSSLPEFSNRQREALSAAQGLERKRLQITDRLSMELKIDKNRFDLSLLPDLLEESYSAKIREVQKALLDLYRKVEIQKEKNQKLIRESQGFLAGRKETNSSRLIQAQPAAKAGCDERRV